MVIDRRLVLGVIFAAIFIILGLLSHGCKLQSDIESWQSALNAQYAQTKIFRNAAGLSQAEAKNANLTISVLQAQHYKELADAQKTISGLKKDLSNLQSSITVSHTTSGSLTTILRDTIFSVPGHLIDTGRAFTYSDRWTKIDGYFLRDSASINYRVYDSVQIVQFWKRQPGLFGIFKARELTTTAISLNPHSDITNLRTITLKDRPKRWVLGPYGGIDITLKPSFGLALTYKLLEF